MNNYWVTFTDGSEGCCQGQSEYDAKVIAEHITKKTVVGGRYDNIAAKRLPYPARPIIWQFEHPVHGKTPDFCYSPRECAGKSCCPKPRACDD
jgi:hypothetical protein